tara:strand:- start:197 stop:634 length:438 start_codon:yes stop_codon:yes gene_type:complete
MKLYIPSLNLSNINSKLINKYLYKQYNINYIFSNSGIFSVKNNKLCKILIKDKPIEKLYIHDILCFIDSSEFIEFSEYYQIPFNHTYEIFQRSHYILRKNALIEFIVDTYNNSVIDAYFIIKNKNDNFQEDIVTFLSDLTFIKNI